MTEALAIKDRIETYWSKAAQGYDSHFGHGIHSDMERELWLALLRDHIPFVPGAAILDVGCGTGFLSLLLAQLGYTVTGIDLSGSMRAEALRKAGEMGLAIDVAEGDAEAPDFAPHTFDAVISRHLVWTLPYPAKALGAWRKLLKPGGRVVIIDGVWTPRNLAGRVRHFFVNLIRRFKGDNHHSSWKKEYVQSVSHLPFFGGAEPEKIETLLRDGKFKEIVRDDMQAILAHERRHGPLEYRIAYAKNRRYLISGKK
ncbi:MAG: class I SAM-dependent methyltransferase [Desulfosarcinaceae bacterium]|jgi:SAM-dependent methyltransferase